MYVSTSWIIKILETNQHQECNEIQLKPHISQNSAVDDSKIYTLEKDFPISFYPKKKILLEFRYSPMENKNITIYNKQKKLVKVFKCNTTIKWNRGINGKCVY